MTSRHGGRWARTVLLAMLATQLLVSPGCSPPPATAQDTSPAGRVVEIVGQVSAPPADVAVVELPFPAEVRLRVHPGDTVREGDTLADLRFPDGPTRERLATRALETAEAEFRDAERRYSPRLTTARRWLEEARGSAIRVHEQPRPVAAAVPQRPPQGSSLYNLERAEATLAEAETYVESLLLPHRRRLAMARTWAREARAEPGPAGALRAPMSGRVAAVTASTPLTSGPVVTLTRTPRLSVHAKLPLEWSARLLPGTEVQVVLADGRSVGGVVESIVTREVWRGNSATGQVRGAEAEDRTAVAVVGLSSSVGQEMTPGQWVTVRLPLDPERGLLSPPLQASLTF